MNAPKLSKPTVLATLCGIALLGACGDDASTRLSQPQLAESPPLTLLADVQGPNPTDTTTTPDGTDADNPPDLVVPPDVVVTDVGTDVISPDDVGPTDTVEADVAPIACQRAADCPDNPPCGRGACVDGFCSFTAVSNGAACDDGDLCSTGDRCSAGRCVGTGHLDCDNGNACTAGVCVPGEGCVQEPVNCDDESVCTQDSCTPDVGCVHTPIVCPGGQGPCQAGLCDPQDGCRVGQAPDGTACQDENPCTINDQCSGGACNGAPRCDDNNICTSDACLPGGTCLYTPLVGCVISNQCQGRPGGEPCNDNNAETSADMCIAGVCKGYLMRRVAGSAVAGYQGLVIQEVDHGPDGWSAVFWSARLNDASDDVQAWSLARITDPSAPFVHSGTTTTDGDYTSLSAGMVIRSYERVLTYGVNGWTTNNSFDRAVSDQELGFLSALYSRTDLNANGTLATRRAWVGGAKRGEGLVLACRTTADGARCDPQTLNSPEDGPYPVALAGIPICAQSGSCSNQYMGAAARLIDAGSSGSEGYFNDTYVNATGAGEEWSLGWLADDVSSDFVWAMTAWGSSVAPRMLTVGSGGFMQYMSGANNWGDPINVRADQEDRTFTGVTVSADTVLVSATRFTATEAVYELWTVPTNRDASNSANWNVHELGRGPDVEAAGLYNIGGRPNGEVMAVGGTRRATINGQVPWLDGLIYWRQGP